MKRNIRDLNIGLDTLLKLHPVSFNWKSTGDSDFGFIAEDVEAVDPLLAEYNKRKLSGVKYSQLTALITKTIQEFHAQSSADSAGLWKELKRLKSDDENLRERSDHDHAAIIQLKADSDNLRARLNNDERELAELKRATGTR